MFISHFLIIVLKSIERSLRKMKFYGAYLKVGIVNLVIALYMFSILRMIYFATTKFTDEFPWDDDGSEDMKKRIAVFTMVKKCLNESDLNTKIIIILRNYRKFEQTIFFSSIISLILYGILCKIFILAKRLLTSQENLA